MNIEQAAQYWKQKLSTGQPIYRVRVRRLLEYAGAERRGWTIMRRIGKTLEKYQLETDPDFRSTWIDGLVTIRLVDQGAGTAEQSGDTSGSDSEEIGQDVAFELAGDDSLIADAASSDDSSGKVAEELNVPEGNAGVVEVPTAVADSTVGIDASIDPIRRISSIASANRGVVSVNLQDSIQKATTLMMFEGYSQLAIMQGERTVRGIISWESIAKRSMLAPEPTSVSDCRVDAQLIEADGTLFEALPTIEKYGYVLVRSKAKITGILTASDLAIELQSLSYAFMSIGTIEGLIRKKLHPQIVSTDMALLEEHSKARVEGDVSLMTFGENVRLLERDEVWTRLAINVDKKEFIRRLLIVRDIRNDVMHFNPDPLGQKQKRELEQMEEFLRQVFRLEQ